MILMKVLWRRIGRGSRFCGYDGRCILDNTCIDDGVKRLVSIG